MSKKLCEFKDKYGSLSLEKHGNILQVNINSACGIDLINFYIKKIRKFAPLFSINKWGLLSNSLGYEAATPEAEIALVEFCKICIELGCRVEAYCMISPVAIEQTRRMRLSYGNNIPIEDALFASQEKAEIYMTKTLEQLNAKSYLTH